MIDITPFLMTYQYGHHKGGHGKHPNPTPIPGHPGHPGNPCHPIPGGGHHCGPVSVIWLPPSFRRGFALEVVSPHSS